MAIDFDQLMAEARASVEEVPTLDVPHEPVSSSRSVFVVFAATATVLTLVLLAYLLFFNKSDSESFADAAPNMAVSGETTLPPPPQPTPPPTGTAPTTKTAPTKKSGTTTPTHPNRVFRPWELPKDPLILKWDFNKGLPAHLKGKGEGLPEQIQVSPNGNLVAIKTGSAVSVWSISHQTCLNGWEIPKGKNAFVAPDVSAVCVEDEKAMAIHTYLPSGKKVGTYAPRISNSVSRGNFSAGNFAGPGSPLVIGFRHGDDRGFHRIDSRSGLGVSFGVKFTTDIVESIRSMHPVPESSLILGFSGGLNNQPESAGMKIIDPKTGKWEPIYGMPTKSRGLEQVSNMFFSGDHRYLAIEGSGAVEVWDWSARRLIFSWKKQYYSHLDACFTPDGKRFLVLANSTHRVWSYGSWDELQGNSNMPTVVGLYDMQSGKLLGEFDVKEANMGLAVVVKSSPDGRRLFLADKETVAVFDFETALKVPPLKVEAR